MSNEQLIEVGKSKTVHYMTLLPTAQQLIERAEENEIGSYHFYLAGLLFYVFTFEAFLNHLGHKLFENWEKDLEKSLSSCAKIRLIADKLKLDCDFSSTPFQSVQILFQKFRNQVVHLKTKKIEVSEIFKIGDEYEEFLHSMIQADWQRFATKDNAKKFVNDLEQAMSALFEPAKQQGFIEEREYLFTPEMQIGSASIKAALKD